MLGEEGAPLHCLDDKPFPLSRGAHKMKIKGASIFSLREKIRGKRGEKTNKRRDRKPRDLPEKYTRKTGWCIHAGASRGGKDAAAARAKINQGKIRERAQPKLR